MQRTVHVITSECEAYVAYEGDMARVRITETDRDLTDPTTFEIEGDPDHIAEALATVSAVLKNREECRREPN
jgi:hypothetical protein